MCKEEEFDGIEGALKEGMKEHITNRQRQPGVLWNAGKQLN